MGIGIYKYIAPQHERGAWCGIVVKSEGPGIDPRSLGIFAGLQTVPCALGSTRPLKMSTRIFLGVKTAGA
jgi:hypothetical protein